MTYHRNTQRRTRDAGTSPFNIYRKAVDSAAVLIADGGDRQSITEQMAAAADTASYRAREAVRIGRQNFDDQTRQLLNSAHTLGMSEVDVTQLPVGLEFIPALGEAMAKKGAEAQRLRDQARDMKQEGPSRFVEDRLRKELAGIIIRSLHPDGEVPDSVRTAAYAVAATKVKDTAKSATCYDAAVWSRLMATLARAPYRRALELVFKRECAARRKPHNS